MKLVDRLRALLGIGCRRVRPKLGLPADRRRPGDRRDCEASAREAWHDACRSRWAIEEDAP